MGFETSNGKSFHRIIKPRDLVEIILPLAHNLNFSPAAAPALFTTGLLLQCVSGI